MMLIIARLTFRQLLGKRRTLLFALLALLPVILAIVFRFAADLGYTRAEDSNTLLPEDAEWVAKALLANIIVASLLPLAALIFSTASLGSEIEDGTAVYLLSKPVPRYQVLIPKIVVAWLVTCMFVVPAAIVASAIALTASPDAQALEGLSRRVGDANELGIIIGFCAAIVAGAAVYTTMFTFLSIATTRAFIIGLGYVFLWEGVVTRLFTGTRIFSVRQYSLGIAELVGNFDPAIYNARLSGGAAIFLMLVVGGLAYWFGLRRLRRWEIGETG